MAKAKKKNAPSKAMTSGTVSDASLSLQDDSMIDDTEVTETTETDDAPPPVTESDAASVEAPAPAAPEAPAPAPAPQPTLQATPIEAGILSGFQHRLSEYVAAMGKGVPINVARGSAQQYNLYRLILDILRQNGSVFTKAWNDLLVGVRAQQKDGCFSELYAFRFINEVKPLSKPEIRVFMNLLHLITFTAESKGRAQALKSIDFASVTKDIPVPGAADKLHGFYYSA